MRGDALGERLGEVPAGSGVDDGAEQRRRALGVRARPQASSRGGAILRTDGTVLTLREAALNFDKRAIHMKS